MKLYAEWCLKPEHRRGTMLPVEYFDIILKTANTGYRGVYMFDENAAKQIIAQEHSGGFSVYDAYTNTLVIDLDSGDEQLKLAEAKLAERGLGYDVWFSGSKGYHIVIPVTEMLVGRNVPYSQKVWVETLDVGADLSLYQHSRILSLPGRVHAKTGKKKVFVRNVPGGLLMIPLLDIPKPKFDFKERGGLGEFETALWKCLEALANEPTPGNRHTALWSIARHFADCGVSMESTLNILSKVNEQWQHAKTSDEIALAVSQAYKSTRT